MIPSLDQANYLRIKGILAAQSCVVKLVGGLSGSVGLFCSFF
jgi:hypothetical protein